MRRYLPTTAVTARPVRVLDRRIAGRRGAAAQELAPYRERFGLDDRVEENVGAAWRTATASTTRRCAQRWSRLLRPAQGAGDLAFKDTNPPTRCNGRTVPLPHPEPGPGVRPRARDEGHPLPGHPPVLRTDPQARRRQRGLRLPAGVDRRRVGLQDHREPRHRPLPQLHRAGPRPDTDVYYGADHPNLHEPFGDTPEANLVGEDLVSELGRHLRALRRRTRAAGRTGCRPRRDPASCSSARASTRGTRTAASSASSGSTWTGHGRCPTPAGRQRGDALGGRLPRRRDAATGPTASSTSARCSVKAASTRSPPAGSRRPPRSGTSGAAARSSPCGGGWPPTRRWSSSWTTTTASGCSRTWACSGTAWTTSTGR